MGCTVRPVRDADRPAVLALVKAAFTGAGHDGREHDGREEVRVVTRTWELGAAPAELDLVAVDDDGVVAGHVLAAPGTLEGGGEGARAVQPGRSVLAVAPLAVLPQRQGRGVGSLLMREVLMRAERAGAPVVLLLGDPGYYGRFGFEPAGPYGVFYPPVGFGDRHFMLRCLGPAADVPPGAFTYCWEEPGRSGA